MTPPPGRPSGDAQPPPLLVIDARGRRCPLPVIELARRIGEVGLGEVAAVLSDDAAARYDVPAWCRMRGHDFLGERAGEGATLYLVRRRT